MIQIVAIVALFLFWLSLFSMFPTVARLIGGGSSTRPRAAIAVLAFLVVLGCFTYSMTHESVLVEIVFGLSWAVPLILSIWAKRASDAIWPKLDRWIYGVAIVLFIPAQIVLIPTAILLAVNILVWS